MYTDIQTDLFGLNSRQGVDKQEKGENNSREINMKEFW